MVESGEVPAKLIGLCQHPLPNTPVILHPVGWGGLSDWKIEIMIADNYPAAVLVSVGVRLGNRPVAPRSPLAPAVLVSVTQTVWV